MTSIGDSILDRCREYVAAGGTMRQHSNGLTVDTGTGTWVRRQDREGKQEPCCALGVMGIGLKWHMQITVIEEIGEALGVSPVYTTAFVRGFDGAEPDSFHNEKTAEYLDAHGEGKLIYDTLVAEGVFIGE